MAVDMSVSNQQFNFRSNFRLYARFAMPTAVKRPNSKKVSNLRINIVTAHHLQKPKLAETDSNASNLQEEDPRDVKSTRLAILERIYSLRSPNITFYRKVINAK